MGEEGFDEFIYFIYGSGDGIVKIGLRKGKTS